MALAAPACLLLLQCSRRSRTIEARPDPSASASSDATPEVADTSDATEVSTPLSPTSWFDEKLHCVVLRELLADLDTTFIHVAPEDGKGPVPSGFAHCAPWRPISIHPKGSYSCKSAPFASIADAELARAGLPRRGRAACREAGPATPPPPTAGSARRPPSPRAPIASSRCTTNPT